MSSCGARALVGYASRMLKRALTVAGFVVLSWLVAFVALACGGPYVIVIGDSDRKVNCAIDADETNGTVVRIPSGLR
jgi:hypothetical protein